MRGLTSVGADTLEAVTDIAVIHVALTHPHAVQSQQAVRALVHVAAVHIQRKGHHFLQADRLVGPVDHTHTAHDGIVISKYGICQQDAALKNRILHSDLQALSLIRMSECRRQAGQTLLTLIDPMRYIIRLDTSMAALCADGHGAVAVVTIQLAGKLMLHAGKDLAPLTVVGGRKERILLIPEQIAKIGISDPLSEINMLQKLLVVHDSHDIADMLCIDLKNSFVFKIANIHFLIPLCCLFLPPSFVFYIIFTKLGTSVLHFCT